MLLKYPWFRVSKPLMEQLWSEGITTYRWATPPGRFIALDRRIVGDPFTQSFFASFRLLRLDWANGVYWWAIRDDAWWVPLAVLFDRLYWWAHEREIDLARFCIARGWVHYEPGEMFSWRKPREVTR